MNRNKKFLSFVLVFTILALSGLNLNIFALDYLQPPTEPATSASNNITIEPYAFYDRVCNVNLNGTTKVEVTSDSNWWSERVIKVNYADQLQTNFQSVRFVVQYRLTAPFQTGDWVDAGEKLVYLGSSAEFKINPPVSHEILSSFDIRVMAYMDSSSYKGEVKVLVSLYN